MFEDPADLLRCIQSDCEAYRAGGTPFCAKHLRAQEVAAGATSIVEPELEARLANIRTEDDEHPGEKKVWHDDGTSEWVPDPDYQPPGKLYVGPDPDTIHDVLRLDVPTWNQRVGIDRPPPVKGYEPRWDEGLHRWILEPNETPKPVNIERVRKLVLELTNELWPPHV